MAHKEHNEQQVHKSSISGWIGRFVMIAVILAITSF